MKIATVYNRYFLVMLFIAATSISATAQLRTGGEVVDVIDGKTVVVAAPTGRITVELQYIDVPEPSQLLHSAVKDHLRTLLIGKSVELQTKGFTRGKVNGKLVLGGVDVSQQLLRDGAAWHLPSNMSGQTSQEFSSYADAESLARKEKLGVWSINGLEPAWEFRAKANLAATGQPNGSAAEAAAESRKSSGKGKGYWSDENPRLKNPGSMTHGFNAATQTGFLGTSMLGVAEHQSQPSGQKTGVDLTYYYTENGTKGRSGYFVVTVISFADNWRFLKENTLTLEIDGKKLVVGKPKREADGTGFKMAEKLTYRVDVATVEKIAHGGSVLLKVGDYAMTPRARLQMILYNMLQVAK